MKALLSIMLGVLILAPQTVQAKWIWSKETGFYNPKYAVKDTDKEQFEAAKKAFDRKSYETSRKLFKRVIKFFPDTKLSAEAQFMIGECYFLSEDYYSAHKAYKTLIKEYPKHGRIQEVIARQYRIGHLFCNGTKRKWHGLPIPAYQKGVEAMKEVVSLDRWDDLADDAVFEIGLCQYRKKNYEDARVTFSDLLQDYPSSEHASRAQYLKGMASYAQIQGPDYDPTKAKEAKRDFKISVDEFEGSEEEKQAREKISKMTMESARSENEIARYYLKNRKLQAALVYFRSLERNYSETPYGQTAKNLLALLDTLEPDKQ